MPEEPKKVVPEKKFPVIKKAEPPAPKGTSVKTNVYIISMLSENHSFFVVCYAALRLSTAVYMLRCCTGL